MTKETKQGHSGQKGRKGTFLALCFSLSARGVSRGTRHLKAQNAFHPLYRKELRKVLLEYLQWMRAMKKDYTFQKVMETQKDLKDIDGFDWLESTELAIVTVNARVSAQLQISAPLRISAPPKVQNL